MNERCYPQYREAIVVKDDDSGRKKDKKTGGIQIRCSPEFEKIDDGDLPWAYPDSGADGFGASSTVGRHKVPVVGSYVRVRIMDPAWQYVYYYDSGPHSFSNYQYKPGSDAVKNGVASNNVSGFSNPDYPEPQVEMMPDGSTYFYDRKRGDMGIQHASGLYLLITKDGNFEVSYVKKFNILLADGSKFKLSVDDSGNLEIDAKKATVKSDNIILKSDNINLGDTSPDDQVAMFKNLEKVLKDLLKHTHVAPGGPTTPAQDASQMPLSAKYPDLSNIKSTTTKVK
jgi:hypothetical protein